MLSAIDDYFYKNAKGKGFDAWVEFTGRYLHQMAVEFPFEAVVCRVKQLRGSGLATKFVRGLRQLNDNKHKCQHANKDVPNSLVPDGVQ